jgi:Transglycosylase SLT domain
MSKKFIITEEERNNIKSLYSVNEQFEFDKIIDYVKDVLKNKDKYFDKFKNTVNNLTSDSDDSKTEPLDNITDKGQKLLDNQLFQDKLDEISDSINIDKDSIIKLMNHESKLDPQVKNSIGCVGLIQFCPDSKNGSTKTIGGKTYNLEELRNNLDKQMDAIKEFWVTGYKSGKIKEPKDLYIYNFFPIAAGKSDDFVLKSSRLSAQKVANSNPVFNRTLGKPRNTPLTVGDLENYYKKTGMV